jgi:hypothetical protein
MAATGEAMGVAMPAAGEAAPRAGEAVAEVVVVVLELAFVAATVAAGRVVAAGAVVGEPPPDEPQAASVPNKTVMTMNPLSDRRSLVTTPDDVSITSPIHSTRLPLGETGS